MQTAPPYSQSEGEPPSALAPASRAGSHSQSPVTCLTELATCEQYWGGASIPRELSPLGYLGSLPKPQADLLQLWKEAHYVWRLLA